MKVGKIIAVSDRYVNPSHNFNKMSVILVLRMKNIIILRGVILLKRQILMTTQQRNP